MDMKLFCLVFPKMATGGEPDQMAMLSNLSASLPLFSLQAAHEIAASQQADQTTAKIEYARLQTSMDTVACWAA